MNWSNLSEFAAMGGYGVYVWGSFGVTAGVMLVEMFSLRARRKALALSAPAIDEEPPGRSDYREGAA